MCPLSIPLGTLAVTETESFSVANLASVKTTFYNTEASTDCQVIWYSTG